MPTRKFICKKCDLTFDENVSVTHSGKIISKNGKWYDKKTGEELPEESGNCPHCGNQVFDKVWQPTIFYIKIRGVTGLDKKAPDGVPIGELPGDSDYEGMNLPGYFGAAP
jgi:hypothetical protein